MKTDLGQSGQTSAEKPEAADADRADAARYRWLRRPANGLWPPVHGSMWVVQYHYPAPAYSPPETRSAGFDEALDVAIDTQRALALHRAHPAPLAHERSAFEAWFEPTFEEAPKWEPDRNCYSQLYIHMAWKGWQRRAVIAGIHEAADAPEKRSGPAEASPLTPALNGALLNAMLDWHAAVTRFGAESQTAFKHFERVAAMQHPSGGDQRTEGSGSSDRAQASAVRRPAGGERA